MKPGRLSFSFVSLSLASSFFFLSSRRGTFFESSGGGGTSRAPGLRPTSLEAGSSVPASFEAARGFWGVAISTPAASGVVRGEDGGSVGGDAAAADESEGGAATGLGALGFGAVRRGRFFGETSRGERRGARRGRRLELASPLSDERSPDRSISVALSVGSAMSSGALGGGTGIGGKSESRSGLGEGSGAAGGGRGATWGRRSRAFWDVHSTAPVAAGKTSISRTSRSGHRRRRGTSSDSSACVASGDGSGGTAGEELPRARSSNCASSRASWGRSAGLFRRQASTTETRRSPSAVEGRSSGGVSSQAAFRTVKAVFPSKGGCPAIIW